VEEEQLLAKWIVTVGKAGFPMTELELIDSIQLLVTEKEKIFPFHCPHGCSCVIRFPDVISKLCLL
jgi:hypothetical protein